jgi:hypothetical protein
LRLLNQPGQPPHELQRRHRSTRGAVAPRCLELQHDLTPSQVVRRLMREYIIEHANGRQFPAWLKGRSQGERGGSA